MLLKLANSLYVTGSANEASQLVATYGATVILVQALCSFGEVNLWLEQSNDSENWAVLGANPLLSLFSGDSLFAPVGAPVGGPVVGARFVRLRFGSNGKGLVTSYLTLVVV